MFCPKCGKEIEDDAVVCVHCGRSIIQREADKPEHQESKTGMGVLFGLLLGLIGLIVGICIYPEGTVARKTFMKGWMITFFVSLGVYIIFIVIILFTTGVIVASYDPYYYY